MLIRTANIMPTRCLGRAREGDGIYSKKPGFNLRVYANVRLSYWQIVLLLHSSRYINFLAKCWQVRHKLCFCNLSCIYVRFTYIDQNTVSSCSGRGVQMDSLLVNSYKWLCPRRHYSFQISRSTPTYLWAHFLTSFHNWFIRKSMYMYEKFVYMIVWMCYFLLW